MPETGESREKLARKYPEKSKKNRKKPKNTALYRGGHRIKESRGNTAVIRRSSRSKAVVGVGDSR